MSFRPFVASHKVGIVSMYSGKEIVKPDDYYHLVKILGDTDWEESHHRLFSRLA